MMMAAQEKTWSYAEWALGDDFIPLAIEMYGCLHSHFDSFLVAYAYTIIVRHQWFFLVPSMLISHYWQCVFIAVQHAQAIVII